MLNATDEIRYSAFVNPVTVNTPHHPQPHPPSHPTHHHDPIPITITPPTTTPPPQRPNQHRHLPPLRGGNRRRRHGDTEPKSNVSCPGHCQGLRWPDGAIRRLGRRAEPADFLRTTTVRDRSRRSQIRFGCR